MTMKNKFGRQTSDASPFQYPITIPNPATTRPVTTKIFHIAHKARERDRKHAFSSI